MTRPTSPFCKHADPDPSADRPTSAVPGPLDPAEMRALCSIAEGTAHASGVEFFETLVKHLATALGTRYAFVAEFAGSNIAQCAQSPITATADSRQRGMGSGGHALRRRRQGKHLSLPDGSQSELPADAALVEMGIESYRGVPLVAPDGEHLGHLAVFDHSADARGTAERADFSNFCRPGGCRAGALAPRTDSRRPANERYRDLFEEAPIAYVHEDLDSRFVRANRAAIRILGLKPEEVAGTVGMSLVADNPENQRRSARGICVHRARYGYERSRSRASSEGQRETHLGAMVVQARARRQIHADDDRRYHRTRPDGARAGPAQGRKSLPAGGNQGGPQL